MVLYVTIKLCKHERRGSNSSRQEWRQTARIKRSARMKLRTNCAFFATLHFGLDEEEEGGREEEAVDILIFRNPGIKGFIAIFLPRPGNKRRRPNRF